MQTFLSFNLAILRPTSTNYFISHLFYRLKSIEKMVQKGLSKPVVQCLDSVNRCQIYLFKNHKSANSRKSLTLDRFILN